MFCWTLCVTSTCYIGYQNWGVMGRGGSVRRPQRYRKQLSDPSILRAEVLGRVEVGTLGFDVL